MLQKRVGVTVLTLFTISLVTSSAFAEEYRFETTHSRGDVDKISVSMEVKGDLRFKDDENNQLDTVPMELSGKAVYFERAIALSSEPTGHSRAARVYETLEAKLDIDRVIQDPKLRLGRSLIGVQLDGEKRTLFSPEGELTRAELDLVETPIDSLLLDRLLPSKPVTLGDTWEVPEEVMIIFTGLDRIKEGRFLCKLIEVDDDRAIVEIHGQIEGATEGVGSNFRVKARYRFDRRMNRVDWLGLVFEETRDIGHVEAGGTAIAKLTIRVTPKGKVADADIPKLVREKLSDEAISKMTFHVSKPLTQLAFIPKQGNWHLTHDRRWFEYGNDHSLGVLRLVDRGDLIAQCNLATIETVDPAKLPTITQFQEGIKTALGDNFDEFLTARERGNDQNYQIYEVVVQGTVGKGTSAELPIQWIYYLVADRHGRQVGLTFTVEPDLLQRLGTSAHEMVNAVRFGEDLAAVSQDSIKK